MGTEGTLEVLKVQFRYWRSNLGTEDHTLKVLRSQFGTEGPSKVPMVPLRYAVNGAENVVDERPTEAASSKKGINLRE
jgi:hypothetical protein